MSTNTPDKTLDRRKFLKVAGCGAVVALVGGGCSLATKAEATCPFGKTSDPFPGECSRYVDRNGNGICDLSEISTTTEQLVMNDQPSTTIESTATSTPEPQVQPATAAPPAAATSVTSTSTGSAGQKLCNHGCRYPGKCRDYVDTNGTGICDMSEMTLAEAQAAGISVSAGGPGRR